MSAIGKKIIEAYTSLKSARSTFDGRLRDITFYVLPEYENQNKDTRSDDNVPDRPVSNSATYFANTLGSNIFSYTYRPGEENFSLRAVNEIDADEVKEWLSHATEITLKAIQNSNFTEVYASMCVLYGTYGTGIVSVMYDDNREELIFRNHSVNGNIYFVENAKGRVCGIYRLLRYTAKQAGDTFKKLPKSVMEALKDPARINEKFDFIEVIEKNGDYDGKRKDSMSMRYRSTCVFQETEEVVHEEGFQTFPFSCPRFSKQTDFPYGYGCGHMALNTIRQLNRAEADYLDAVEMESHPPVWFPDSEAANEAQIKPGFVGYFDPSRGNPFQLKVGSNSVALFQYIQQLRYELSEMFFINTFLSVTQQQAQPKTAREVNEMSQEKLSVVAPMISRLQSELFSPLIERVVDLLITAGVIDAPPKKIAGEGFRVVYTSQIDTKLSSIEVNKTLQAFSEAQALLNMEQETPTLPHVGRIAEAAKLILEKRAISADLIVPDRERKKMKQALDDSLARKEQMEAMQGMAKPVDLQKQSEQNSPMSQMESAV